MVVCEVQGSETNVKPLYLLVERREARQHRDFVVTQIDVIVEVQGCAQVLYDRDLES